MLKLKNKEKKRISLFLHLSEKSPESEMSPWGKNILSESTQNMAEQGEN